MVECGLDPHAGPRDTLPDGGPADQDEGGDWAAGIGLTLEGTLEVGIDWALWGSRAAAVGVVLPLTLLASDQGRGRRTCETSYPDHSACWETGMEYDGIIAALRAEWAPECWTQRAVSTWNSHCEGPNDPYNVKCPWSGSGREGSIMCCTCNEDSPGTGNPVLRYRCRTS